MDDLLVEFLTETNENLAELDVALVRLEREPDGGGTLAQIFRLVHTIKGTCGFLGLPRLEKLAHAAENVLDKVREGALAVTPNLVSTVLAAIDQIKFIVMQLGMTGREPPGSDAALIGRLDSVSDGGTGARAVGVGAPLEMAGFDVAPEREEGELSGHEGAAGEAPGAGQTIRVGVDVLEDLMTLVSELVLTRNQILQLARTQELAAFSAPLQRLSHITSDLQERVMKTRMQPIGHAWAKLPRLVRDLALELDKRIELVMHGADTELDRQVLELIKDPLVHMVRNAADHGLESPAERQAAAKSEQGRIFLTAYHEGGHIIIEIRDDGRGLPVRKIRAQAVAKGIATEAELAAMTDSQILRLVFRPGFSTAPAVTAVSGRGVGMDVVKTNVERMGGTIELDSAEGRGTIFTIKIPLTLAIVSALIVKAGAERFAIPQLGVVELVRARARVSDAWEEGEPILQMIDQTPMLRLRDRLLPLIDLGAFLQLGPAKAVGAELFWHIVVVQAGASLLGLVVDRVFDTEEIVVKPVAPIMRHMTVFSGNTILGDGSVIMILDINGIARTFGINEAAEARRGAVATPRGLGATSERTALLLFRAGGAEPKGVPLGLVARLEEVETAAIEGPAGEEVVQYRGRLMPLVALSGAVDWSRPRQRVLVFADAGCQPGSDCCMGLVVDEIVDVVEDVMTIRLAAAHPGILGRAVIAGKATEIIDTGYWLARAFGDWSDNACRAGDAEGPRVLLVDGSPFFRQLLAPSLTAAGYAVTAVGSAEDAFALADAGAAFDVVIADAEMADMDGRAFVARLRASGAWSALPVIAVTGHVTPAQVEAGRAAGFTDHVQKFERGPLLASLRRCLAARADNRLRP